MPIRNEFIFNEFLSIEPDKHKKYTCKKLLFDRFNKLNLHQLIVSVLAMLMNIIMRLLVLCYSTNKQSFPFIVSYKAESIQIKIY